MISLFYNRKHGIMANSILETRAFQDEAAAYAWVETRVWPDGPICPHCGGTDRIGKLKGKSTRPGVYKCYQCRQPFTVKVGTVFDWLKILIVGPSLSVTLTSLAWPASASSMALSTTS